MEKTKKTLKQKYENKKVYCLFNPEGEKVRIGNVKIYLEKHHIKTALKIELDNSINYHKHMCEILGEEINIPKIIKDHEKKYEGVKVVEYQLKVVKETDCTKLLK